MKNLILQSVGHGKRKSFDSSINCMEKTPKNLTSKHERKSTNMLTLYTKSNEIYQSPAWKICKIHPSTVWGGKMSFAN